MSAETLSKKAQRRPRAKVLGLLLLLGIIAIGLYPLGRYLWFRSRYQSALRAIDRRDFAAARGHLAACVREWPDSAEVRFLAARTARRDGDLESAHRLLNEAEKLGWVREAVELERMLITVQKGQYRSAGPILVDFVHRDHPDAVIILEVLAPALVAHFEVNVAMSSCLEWRDRDPTNPQPCILLGEMHQRMNNSMQARDDFAEAVRRDPDNAEARLKYGQALLDLRHPIEAREHFEWLAAHRSNSPEVIRGLATIRYELGDTDQGRAMMEQLVNEWPDDGRAQAQLGIMLMDSPPHRPDLAEQHLRRALERTPFDIDVIFNLARCLDRLDRSKEAEELRKRGRNSEKDLRQVADFVAALAKNPDDVEPRRQIAIRLMRNGLEVEGKQWLETALKINPRHVPSHRTMADYYRRFGDLKRAADFDRLADQLEGKMPTQKKPGTP